MPISEEALSAEEQAVLDGRRVREILDEPVMRTVLARMKEKYLQLWISGDTVEKREQAHARASVLEAFVQECVNLIEAGKRASIEKAQRSEREEREAVAKRRTR